MHLGEIWLAARELHKFLKAGRTCNMCIREERRRCVVETLGGVGT